MSPSQLSSHPTTELVEGQACGPYEGMGGVEEGETRGGEQAERREGGERWSDEEEGEGREWPDQ